MDAAGSPESGGSGGVFGRGRCGGGIGAHLGLVCTLLWGREAGGEGTRRRSRAAAAGSLRSGERGGAAWTARVPGESSVLGKILKWLEGFGGGHWSTSRGGSLGAPAAEPGAGRGVHTQGGARRP
jgi:hypothetical protein